MAGLLKKTLSANICDAHCFDIQFDEKTDLANDFPLHWQAQLISYVRFPDKESMKVVDHQTYLFCLPTGTDTTAASIFAKFAENFSEHGVTWLKCKIVSIDGARTMIGIRNGVVELIKQVSPEIVNNQCAINREALEDKKLDQWFSTFKPQTIFRPV